MPKHLLARVEELRPGTLRRFEVEGLPVCVARTPDGKIRAISDVCTHELASLSEGAIVGNAVECIEHGSLFDLDTGEPLSLPAALPVRTFALSIEDGHIYITV